MVTFRPNCWFKADFADDTVYDDGGNEVQFAGQAVAQTVAQIMSASGYKMDEPESWDENGWSLNATRKGSRFWMLVTLIDDYILQTKDSTWRLWAKPQPYIEFLRDLEAALKTEPRFSQLRWFSKDWPPTEAEIFAGPLDAPRTV